MAEMTVVRCDRVSGYTYEVETESPKYGRVIQRVLLLPRSVIVSCPVKGPFPLSETFDTAFLLGTIAPGWVVRQSIPLRVERDEDGSYLVSDDLWGIYGEGPDREAAIRDYVRSLVEFYGLIEGESRDHPPTGGLFGRIRQFVTGADD